MMMTLSQLIFQMHLECARVPGECAISSLHDQLCEFAVHFTRKIRLKVLFTLIFWSQLTS